MFQLPADLELPVPSAKELEALSSPSKQTKLETKIRNKTKNRQAREAVINAVIPLHAVESRLRNASNSGDKDTVLRCIAEGADVNGADDKKRTALHFASCKGDKEMVQLLISRGANPNNTDCNGNTPLHLAACTNHIDVITQLLKCGTDINIRDGMGRTPLHYAQSHLRFMTRFSHRYTDMEYRNQIAEVVNLLREFLSRLGDDAGMEGVEGLEERLAKGCKTRESVDDLQGLIDELTTLAIERNNQ